MTAQSVSFRRGTVKVALGVASFGVANYVFLAGATRLLGPAGYAQFMVFWGLVYGLGLGLCLPFEQEISRRISITHSTGSPTGPTLRAAYRTTGIASVLLTVVTIPVAMVYSDPGDVPTVVALCGASYLALAMAYVSRGALSGSGQFGRYAVQFGIEGLVRVLAVVLVATAIVRASIPAFALAVPVALMAGVFATTSLVVRGAPALEMRVLVRSLAPIIVSSMIVQSLINLGPVTINLLTDASERALAGSFLAAAVVTRIPILAFSAVQAVLIPRLVRSVMAQDHRDFRRGLVVVLLPTIGIGVLGMLAWLVVGPALLHLLAGAEYNLPRGDFVILAIGVALYLVCNVLQAAALALGEHLRMMRSWLLGAVSFVAASVLPLTPTHAVGWAMVAGFGVAAVALGLVVRQRMTHQELGWSPTQPPMR